VPSSTFTTEKVLERGDLQRLLRARIDAIADDVLIVAEEFGAFADAAGFGRRSPRPSCGLRTCTDWTSGASGSLRTALATGCCSRYSK
jgi:hypothetical protein